MDRLLRKALETTASGGDGCLDAETVAAWADGALDARARSTVEAHAARCARCQALVAAMARTAPEPAASAWWRASPIRWLVPIAAGALAVTIWVMVPPSVDQNRSPGASGPGTPVEQVAAEPELKGKAAQRGLQAQAGRLAERDEERRGDNAELKKESAPQRSRAADSFGSTPADAASTLRQQDAAAPAPRPRADLLREDRDAAAKLGPRAFEPDGVIVRSPDPAVRWLIAPGGAVRRSADGGATWTEQQIGPVQALAGAAPSVRVCWLVGRRGVVLLTVDGATWRQVTAPAQADLVAVRAADDKSATVTAVDGQIFTTTDSGRTWRPVAPQEFPASPFQE